MIEAVGRTRPAWVLLAAMLLASCGSGPDGPEPDGASGQVGLPRGVLTITGDGPEVRVRVEIAETTEAKLRGLMHRTSLAPDGGMVFLEEEPATTGFWMKDTLIPLSVAFWGEDGRIFRILDMEPCQEESCPVYEPGGAWVGALEVNRGFFEAHGVRAGDRVRLTRD